ncbi:PHP domain-containing protein [Nitrincola tapanii]|uniref:PHP domain-containing protein n=1 Tax=Nitrincola tapanii TaxID=1708751 RepID=A0A5A9VZD8_9GAMM|nr:PHP domain-containing protein [Nitrincola tapanii]KAA0873890.1 PHP domain-containing protein [Nitrincola tapanii]
MHYDLHLHSNASDGALAPTELIQLCASESIEYLAITDHDTCRGYAEAQAAATQVGIHLFAGIEFTCLWKDRVIHVLGLGLDLTVPALQQYMDELVDLRMERAERIANKLIKKGLPADLLARVLAKAGEGQVGRPHFASVLVELGVVDSEQAAFEKYLGQSRPGHVKVLWPDLARTLELIQQLKGFSIIAHPTKYRFTFTKLRALVDDFIQLGGQGVEVSYPGLNPDQGKELQRLAAQKNLLLSAGSDFHSKQSAWSYPGRFPSLEMSDQHVLMHLIEAAA